MTKVNTVNILLTSDFDLMRRYFLDGDNNSGYASKDIISLQKEVEGDPNSFFINSTANASFLRLEHDINYSRKEGATIKIELVDPTTDFENKFVKTTPPEFMKNDFAHAKEIEEFLKRKALNRLSGESKKELDLLIKMGASRLAGVPGLREEFEEQEKKVEDLATKQVGVLRSNTISDRFVLAQAEREFLGNLSTKLSHTRYYISYGIGNNTGDWSGPFSANFVKIETVVGSGGSRKIILYFVPNLSPHSLAAGLLHDDRIQMNLRGFGLRCQGRSEPLGKIAKVSRDGTSVIRYTPSNVNFHKLLTQAMQDFLSKSFGSEKFNVLVLLPDIDTTHAHLIEDSFKKYSTSVAKSDGTHFINKFLHRFGAELSRPPSTYDLAYYGPDYLNVETKEVIREKIRLEDIKAKYSTEILANQTCTISADDSNVRDLDRVKGFPNYDSVMWKFQEGFTNGNPTYPIINSRLYLEDNVKILKLWKDFGYIKSDSVPAVVFADYTMAEYFLYGRYFDPKRILDHLHVPSQPLTEEDSKKYKNNFRLSKLAEVTRRPFSTLYGGTENLADDFAIAGSRAEGLADLAKSAQIPVFRFNVANSNVLDLKVDLNAMYLKAVNAALTTNQQFTAANVFAKSNQDAYPPASYNVPQEFINHIQVWANKYSTEKIIEKIKQYPDFIGSEPADADKLAKFIYAIYLATYENGDRSQIFKLPDELGINPIQAQQAIFEELFKAFKVVSMKTLPMFNLSMFQHITHPAILFGKQLNFVGADRIPEVASSFFSGSYIISAFKHTITSRDAYSEFVMVSDIRQNISVKEVAELETNENS